MHQAKGRAAQGETHPQEPQFIQFNVDEQRRGYELTNDGCQRSRYITPLHTTVAQTQCYLIHTQKRAGYLFHRTIFNLFYNFLVYIHYQI